MRYKMAVDGSTVWLDKGYTIWWTLIPGSMSQRWLQFDFLNAYCSKSFDWIYLTMCMKMPEYM